MLSTHAALLNENNKNMESKQDNPATSCKLFDLFFSISLFLDPRRILLSPGDVRGILRALSRKLSVRYCIWFLLQFCNLRQTLGIIFDCLL